MDTNTRISSLLLMTALGATSTNIILPYQINLLSAAEVIPKYNEIKELNGDKYTGIDEKTQVDTIINFSLRLISNSKNIESEYVEFVNKNFWDLI